jgi:dipeptidyl aminopeptidase/acylaminoacyl peptidase
VLDADGTRLLTRHETPTSPPNYVLRTLPDGRQALTDFPDPSPQLTGVSRQLITYTRADGVQLSGTLYLPPGHEAGGTWPLLMWAYPTEYSSAATASQISSSPHRFMSIRGASHLLLLTQGYAILDNPSMPIVGEDDTANDTYVEQLVASAEAAVDHVVTLGVADQHRIGVGGHSYGAFMTANLLAHTDLFRAGIARSGAYNRTLTPFGFQAERRTFWEVPDLYARMSPFWHAHRINEPILLLHGEVDNNAGTFPIQSERLYMALKGHGATVRYVTLPHESHGYTARESVLHTVAEMVDWMNVHVKTPPPATDDQASVQR